MIKGSCLCGGIKFEIEKAVGPFELCHCRRCRKASGAAFFPTLGVLRKDFHLVAGGDLIASYEAPIIREPPAYRTFFCRRCGSPAPDPDPSSEWLEVPGGLLDDDPGLRPDKHIFVEHRAPWYEIADRLPQYDRPSLVALRSKAPRASGAGGD